MVNNKKYINHSHNIDLIVILSFKLTFILVLFTNY